MPIQVQDNIPMVETRGRPPSEEHLTLLNMRVGSSFVSKKRRETLYQLARSIGVKVRVMREGKAWRVWKRSVPGIPKERKPRKKIDNNDGDGVSRLP